MKQIIKIVGAILLLVAGIGYLVYTTNLGVEKDKQQVCSKLICEIVDQNKLELISESEIDRILKTKDLYPVGKKSDEIKSKEIEDALAQHPMISGVECFKTPSGDVKLIVKQKKPVLRVMGNEDYFVDETGEIIPVDGGLSLYIPLITGRVNKSSATGEVFEFVQFLQKNSFWNDQIEQININNMQEVQLIPRVGDHLIILGDFDRFEQKLEKLRQFYLHGLSEIGWDLYAKIDLRYNNQIVCTHK